jgi:hypothetical protein
VARKSFTLEGVYDGKIRLTLDRGGETMPSDDLERLNQLHLEIRREMCSIDRLDSRLWDFVERLTQEILILRAQIEGELGRRPIAYEAYQNQDQKIAD